MPPRLLVIPCAGSGERFRRSGGRGKKQFLELAGLPVFLHVLRLFEAVPEFTETVLVVSPEDEAVFREWLSPMVLDARGLPASLARTRLVHGGRERFESVYAGLHALQADSGTVFIHDAARPLLHPDDLRLLIRESTGFDGGLLPGEPLRDTVKRVDGEGWVEDSPPRKSLMAVSTPQIFPLGALRKAYEAVLHRRLGPDPTDDAEVFTRAGGRVRVIALAHPNPKITTTDDLDGARLLLNRRASTTV
ncbi:MAG: 2-C-methyl-D-erythritol 4-phosphate cytidylyltransferase [Spirochaetes bacterium]|nr:2-C-methyl-D-erythritol 4-phosphate cytidylyltransferase [Spirochaetota bacterium]